MSATPLPDFFFRFAMRRTGDAELEHVLAASAATLDILFLWGRDCPNCDLAKRAILAAPASFQWPDVRWLHGNVYAEPNIGIRFGLHGVPTFMVFHRGRTIGRITPWPGSEAFVAAIDEQRAVLATACAAPVAGSRLA